MSRAIDQKLLLSLLKDYLIHNKLLDGLDDLGLETGHYCLNLSVTIFNLMGIDNDNFQNDALFEHFLELCERVKYVEFKDSHEALDKLTAEIYTELKQRSGLPK